jgi:hypothetical protein
VKRTYRCRLCGGRHQRRTCPLRPDRPIPKREALVIAGAIAPVLRRQTAAGPGRPIKVTDRDGNVRRVISSAELAVKVAERAGVEFDAGQGQRPNYMFCTDCGTGYSVRSKGPGAVSKRCPRCRTHVACTMCGKWRSRRVVARGHACACGKAPKVRPLMVCTGCGLSKPAPHSYTVAQRTRWRCRSCAMRLAWTNPKYGPAREAARARTMLRRRGQNSVDASMSFGSHEKFPESRARAEKAPR